MQKFWFQAKHGESPAQKTVVCEQAPNWRGLARQMCYRSRQAMGSWSRAASRAKERAAVQFSSSLPPSPHPSPRPPKVRFAVEEDWSLGYAINKITHTASWEWRWQVQKTTVQLWKLLPKCRGKLPWIPFLRARNSLVWRSLCCTVEADSRGTKKVREIVMTSKLCWR